MQDKGRQCLVLVRVPPNLGGQGVLEEEQIRGDEVKKAEETGVQREHLIPSSPVLVFLILVFLLLSHFLVCVMCVCGVRLCVTCTLTYPRSPSSLPHACGSFLPTNTTDKKHDRTLSRTTTTKMTKFLHWMIIQRLGKTCHRQKHFHLPPV